MREKNAQDLHLLIFGLLLVGLDSPWNKLSKKSKIIENGVRSKKLGHFHESRCAVFQAVEVSRSDVEVLRLSHSGWP